MIHPIVAALATVILGILVGAFFEPYYGIIVAIADMGACMMADCRALHKKDKDQDDEQPF